jgi:hypothetical protein
MLNKKRLKQGEKQLEALVGVEGGTPAHPLRKNAFALASHAAQTGIS